MSDSQCSGEMNLENKWWSWWDSNPRPNIFPESFLHAYFSIDCRNQAGAEQTNRILSCMVLINRHSLRLKHPCFF
ncbi:MAG: hypothetical protein RLY46_1092 [Bacteroidota bacterium]